MNPDNSQGDSSFPENLLPSQLCYVIREIFAKEILQSLLNLEMIAFLQEENEGLTYSSPERNNRNGFVTRDVTFVRQDHNEEYALTLRRPRDRKGRFKSIILQSYYKRLHFKMESLVALLEKYQDGNESLADEIHYTLSQVFGYRFTDNHICYIADQLLTNANELNIKIKAIVEKAQILTDFSIDEIGRFFRANIKLPGQENKRKPGRIKIGYCCSEYGKSKKEVLQNITSPNPQQESYSRINKLKKRRYRDNYDDDYYDED